MQVLEALLTSPLQRKPFESVAAFWSSFRPVLARASLPIDAAIWGGFGADRLASAFAAGYQAALRALVPGLPNDRLVSLCITEKGGGHPRAIQTTLSPREPSGYWVNGDKRWASLCSCAGLLLCAVKVGEDPTTKRPSLKIARIDPERTGVRMIPMHVTPFVPEIPHAEVSLTNVAVDEADLLPGDGYEHYIKPFRTVEDLHIHAAIAAYFVFVARELSLPHGMLERLLCLLISLRALAADDPNSPIVHLGASGAFAALSEILTEMEGPFAARIPEEHARYERDRALFAVASHVRAERTKKAWERLGVREPQPEVER